MRLAIRASSALAATLALTSCNLDGAGGGGDVASLNFTRGYAFIRDRDVYIADKADYEKAGRLSSGANSSDPAMSPDGRSAAYIRTSDTGETSLMRGSVGGGTPTTVVTTPGKRLSQPAWSADSQHIAYVVDDGAFQKVFVINADGTGEQALGSGGGHDTSPAYTSNRIFMLAGASLSRDNIDVSDTTGTTRSTALSASAVGLAFGRFIAVAPGGAAIAFEAGSPSRVYVANVLSSGQVDFASVRQLTDSGGNDRHPTFVSATRLGYDSDAGGQHNVYELDISTRPPAAGALTIGAAEQPSFGG